MNKNNSIDKMVSTIRDIFKQEFEKIKVEVPYFGKVTQKNNDGTYKVNFSDPLAPNPFYVSNMVNQSGHTLNVNDSVLVKAINNNFTNAYIDKVAGDDERVHKFNTPTLATGWSNYGAEYSPARYIKDSAGFVHLGGLIKNTTSVDGVNNVCFILPSGCRPFYRLIFSQNRNGLFNRIDIMQNGEVYIYLSGGSTNYVSLDGIIFKAEQ